MKKNKVENYYSHIALGLIVLSIILFGVHFLVFGEIQNTIYYSMMNVCFIPINTFFVSIVFDRLIHQREKKESMIKLNMLVGLFFIEMGYDLLKILSNGDEKIETIIDKHIDFKDLNKTLQNHDYTLNLKTIDKVALQNLLIENKGLMTTLMGNESVLDKETFFNLLVAILRFRGGFVFKNNNTFSDDEMKRLSKNLSKIYKTLMFLWYEYSDYLNSTYPKAYSEDLFNNPFNNIK